MKLKLPSNLKEALEIWSSDLKGLSLKYLEKLKWLITLQRKINTTYY